MQTGQPCSAPNAAISSGPSANSVVPGTIGAPPRIAAASGGEIVVHPFENLLIDCARDVGAGIIIRGLRAVADFEYEYQMVGMNRQLDASVETVFLMADAQHQATL